VKRPKQGSTLQSIHAPSLADLAYEQLLELISSGEYGEGDRIVIDTVARHLGVSRIPVREALARLHAERLLSYERNKGYRVLPKRSHQSLFEARLVIEPSVIRYFGDRITGADLDELRDINDKIAQLNIGKRFKPFVDFFRLNDEFHAVIVSISGNPLIEEGYKSLSYGPQWARFAYGKGIPDQQTDVEEHERIIDALERRDLKTAEKLSEDHIINGLKRFNEVYLEPEA